MHATQIVNRVCLTDVLELILNKKPTKDINEIQLQDLKIYIPDYIIDPLCWISIVEIFVLSRSLATSGNDR